MESMFPYEFDRPLDGGKGRVIVGEQETAECGGGPIPSYPGLPTTVLFLNLHKMARYRGEEGSLGAGLGAEKEKDGPSKSMTGPVVRDFFVREKVPFGGRFATQAVTQSARDPPVRYPYSGKASESGSRYRHPVPNLEPPGLGCSTFAHVHYEDFLFPSRAGRLQCSKGNGATHPCCLPAWVCIRPTRKRGLRAGRKRHTMEKRIPSSFLS